MKKEMIPLTNTIIKIKMESFDYFMKGAISGATGILCSHPIDTIKSNIQDNKPIKLHPKFLFRGIASPFWGMGIEKAIVFGVYHNTYSYLERFNKTKTSNRIIAGASAGLAASFVVTPIERIKILSQTNNLNHKTTKNIRFLYKGFSNTLTREIPGFSIYFSSYEMMKEHLSYKKKLDTIDYFLMGGTSGFLSWFFIYPQDLVKTKIQASVEKKTTIETIKKIYSCNGIRGFFRGFYLALIRSVPLHAGTFAMFEFLNDLD